MNMPRLRPYTILFLAVAAACARHSGPGDIADPVSVPRFETRTELSTGTVVHADYHIADLDGDTVLDMAVIGLGEQTGKGNEFQGGELRILLGNKSDFVLAQSEQIGGLPLWIAGGDLDGDLDRDLVIVRSEANSTDVWFNNGQGGFTAGPSLPVGLDALAVVVGDVNADGKLDILVSRPAAPEIVVYVGDGLGAFTAAAPITLPDGGSAFNLQIGDVTRDQRPDLIVADPVLSRVLVYPGLSGSDLLGEFAYQLDIPGAPRAVSIGDLDSDGWSDMAVSAFEANKFVVVTELDPYQNESGADGGGSSIVISYRSFEIPVAAPPSVSVIADATGDSVVDLVACLLGTASMVVVPQQAAQGFGSNGMGEHIQLDATGLPLRPFVGDFDQDGKNDLFALSGLGDRVNYWRARPSGDLIGARNYGVGLPSAAWLAGGDFDGDGDKEVAVGSFDSTRLSIMERRADGALVAAQLIEVGSTVFQVESADLDFDGLTDLMVCVPGGVKLLRNRSTPGAYSFEVLPGSPSTVGSAQGPFGVIAADLDRDGALDLAVCDFQGGKLGLVRGTATPFVFGAETVLEIGGAPVDVVAADFTGDGRLDLAVSRIASGNLAVLRNEGNFVFTEYLTVPVGESPEYLLTADFDRNGRADLVVSNGASGTITVLFGNATGFSPQTYPAGASPTALLADDLTGDGLTDILVTSLASGDFRVMVGNGAGSFPGLFPFPGTLGASDAVLQDMDGDGKVDLLISSLVSSRVSLVRNIRD